MRGQSRFTVVSLGIYIHVSPFYFSIGLQMQKGERLLGEREFTLVGCFRYRPLPTDCFLDLDAKYLPSFRAVEWKMSFKSATILLNLFNFSSFLFIFLIITSCICIFLLLRVFSCTFEKLFTWNIMVWDKIFFFFFIDFLYLYSCSFSNRE